MSLRNLFLQTIQQGLQRKSIQKPSTWAELYRVMGTPFPGPWSWEHHPWLKEMHDSEAHENIGQKAAQMGYSELALNLVFYHLDIPKMDCLYILPNTRPDAQDFSTTRFNKAIELSTHIKGMFTETNREGLKKAGTAMLYVRGSNSRKQMKSIPTGIIIFDELDEMEKEHISLAEERASGQIVKKNWKISTPTIPGKGINDFFVNSTQEEFFFPCPSCSKQIIFKFPESLVVTGDSIHDPQLENSHYICYECKNVLAHENKPEFLKHGKWVKKLQTKNSRGFHISQLYSSTVSPAEMAAKFLKAQNNQVDEQEFFNSKLGLPHIVKGAQVLEADIINCMKDYKQIEGHNSPTRLMTMGIDVGRVCHYEIAEWFLTGTDATGPDLNMFAFPEIVKIGTCDFPELVKLMNFFKIKAAVIDYLPETRKSIEFANKFPGYVYCCLYNHHVKAKNISSTDKHHTVSVNRTAWLDLSLGRFMGQRIRLPQDTPEEYKSHIQAPVKVSRRDTYGDVQSHYETQGMRADHFAHARNYCEIALPFAMGYGPTVNSEKMI